ncbi:HAMP domain-containing methyl-accepting chemotaxis protein [Marinobacter sp. C2H3]|uniref:HAMP domain-containing methyl-accepting chemotaxis protein n=1 Tax=Marinobacter sp. C2H3 TaxID=3119003 RepID=UPI00300ECAA5
MLSLPKAARRRVPSSLPTLTIGRRLAVGFSLLIVLSVATGLIGIQALNRYSDRADNVALTGELASDLLLARTEQKNFLLEQDPAYAEKAAALLKSAEQRANTLAANSNSELPAQIAHDARQFRELLAEVVSLQDKTVTARDQLTLQGRVLEASMNNESRLYLATAMLKQMQRDERDYLITHNPDAVRQFDDRLKRILPSIRASALSGEEQTQAIGLFNNYASAFHAAAELIGRTETLNQSIETVASDGRKAAQALQAEETSAMKAQQHTATLAIGAATLAAIVIGVVLSLLLTRGIVRPIRAAVAAARQVADGDLTADLSSTRQDESGQLLNALGQMIGNLRGLVAQIDQNAATIADASERLTRITADTSEDASRQSEQTDQVATAMNEMVATVAEVARNAEEASAAAHDASGKAGTGEASVEQTLSRVAELNEQVLEVQQQLNALQADTQSIGSVLDVIKAVADQTNLLALNAAIEAARAGEQGRGFAVVADEVRSLAQRTQTSAQDIEGMIQRLVASAENTVRVMTTGARLAEDTLDTARSTGEAIAVITRSVDSIRDLNQQIATAAEQQTSVAEEINQNVTAIRDVGERTAGATRDITDASAELAGLADNLKQQVARFAT